MKNMKTMTLTIMILLGICAIADSAAYTNNNVSFKIEIDPLIKRVPYIVIFEEGVYEYDAAKVGQKKIQATSVQGKTYIFDLEKQNKPLYFSVLLTDQRNALAAIDAYHFEPGDQIHMFVKPTKLWDKFDAEFSGPGSAKYRCRVEMLSSASKNEASGTQFFMSGKESGIKDADLLQANHSYRVIEQFKPELSVYSYNLLHADVLGILGQRIFTNLELTINNLRSKKDTAGINNAVKSFKMRSAFDFTKNVPESVLANSKEYPKFLLARYRTESIMDFGSVNYKAMFEHIKKVDQYSLREQLFLRFFLENWHLLGDDFEDCYNDSIRFVKDPQIFARIKAFNNNRVGSEAQNFTLADSSGKMVSLSDFKGRVVFIDFWYTGCGACKLYYQHVLSKIEERYANNSNVVFITISPDSKDIWLQSLKNGKHTSAKVINLYTNGEGYNHKIIKAYNVMEYPRPIVISKRGKIACVSSAILRKEDGLGRTIEKELAAAK